MKKLLLLGLIVSFSMQIAVLGTMAVAIGECEGWWSLQPEDVAKEQMSEKPIDSDYRCRVFMEDDTRFVPVEIVYNFSYDAYEELDGKCMYVENIGDIETEIVQHAKFAMGRIFMYCTVDDLLQKRAELEKLVEDKVLAYMDSQGIAGVNFSIRNVILG